MPAWAWVARSRGQYSLGRLAWPAQKRACELLLSEPIEPHDLGAFAGLRRFVSFFRRSRRGRWNGDRRGGRRRGEDGGRRRRGRERGRAHRKRSTFCGARAVENKSQ